MKTFKDLHIGDKLTSFATSDEAFVVDHAVVVYFPREGKVRSLTEKQLGKLGLSFDKK